jgi:hypothetical protein
MWPIRRDVPHVYNEQTKLTATFLNTLAAFSFTLGIVTPLVSQEAKLAYPIAGFLLAALFHLTAQFILRSLEPPPQSVSGGPTSATKGEGAAGDH